MPKVSETRSQTFTVRFTPKEFEQLKANNKQMELALNLLSALVLVLAGIVVF